MTCACGCGQTTSIAQISDRRTGRRKGEPCRFVRGHGTRGARQWLWKGGRSHDRGYVTIRMPDHHRAHRGTGYVFEHVLVAERALGRPLVRKHPVHHVDESKANNANSNLVICQDEAYHRLLHSRMRALAATGNANAILCRICGSYDRQDDISVLKSKPRVGAHRRCAVEATRRYRLARRSA